MVSKEHEKSIQKSIDVWSKGILEELIMETNKQLAERIKEKFFERIGEVTKGGTFTIQDVFNLHTEILLDTIRPNVTILNTTRSQA